MGWGLSPLDYLVIIARIRRRSTDLAKTAPVRQVAHLVYQSDSDHIAFLPTFLLLFRVVDPHKSNFPRVLDNISFFHHGTAVYRLPTASGGSVHEKGFLHTNPYPCSLEDQSGSDVGDKMHQSRHNILQLDHVSVPDELFPHQSCDVEKIHSETNW